MSVFQYSNLLVIFMHCFYCSVLSTLPMCFGSFYSFYSMKHHSLIKNRGKKKKPQIILPRTSPRQNTLNSLYSLKFTLSKSHLSVSPTHFSLFSFIQRHRNPLLSQRLSRSFPRRCLHSLLNPAHRLAGFAKPAPQPTAEHTSLSYAPFLYFHFFFFSFLLI